MIANAPATSSRTSPSRMPSNRCAISPKTSAVRNAMPSANGIVSHCIRAPPSPPVP